VQISFAGIEVATGSRPFWDEPFLFCATKLDAAMGDEVAADRRLLHNYVFSAGAIAHLSSQLSEGTVCRQSVRAPNFSPGERVFKPARTLYLAMIGLYRLRKNSFLLKGTAFRPSITALKLIRL
jgi:hypothetical protein